MVQSSPQVAGRAVVVHENSVLLVNGDGDGTFWVPPGGRSNLGEDIRTCVRREVFEETGLTVSVGPLIAVSEYYEASAAFHILQAHFLCGIESGTLNPDWIDHHGPVRQARFFTADDMRKLPRVFPEFLIGFDFSALTTDLYKGFEVR